MLTYIIRRLILSIPILFGVALISFLLVYLAPGDPLGRFLTPNVRPEVLEKLREIYGLDKPLFEQFVGWITHYVQVWDPLAWGISITHRRPVLELIMERAPATLLLMGSALAITVIVAVPLGMLAAIRQYSVADKVVTTFATIGYAMPSFVIGTYLLYIGAVWTGIFPFRGMTSSLRSEGDPLDIAWHMVLPVASLSIQSIAGWSRYVRATMLEVLHQDYIRTAKAKGLGSSRVNFRHALRNALIPVVTLFGLSLPSLIAGAAITEAIFSWPGLGSLGLQAVGERDYPVVMAFVLLGGIAVVLGNLIADILYGVVDPRIKY
ncbi:MAG TPA: ABC transporter permease [Candidatus Limnocylindria bacterium]|nr:ABC transporter permease [Candidatus Limnocylindria bacterium]